MIFPRRGYKATYWFNVMAMALAISSFLIFFAKPGVVSFAFASIGILTSCTTGVVGSLIRAEPRDPSLGKNELTSGMARCIASPCFSTMLWVVSAVGVSSDAISVVMPLMMAAVLISVTECVIVCHGCCDASAEEKRALSLVELSRRTPVVHVLPPIDGPVVSIQIASLPGDAPPSSPPLSSGMPSSGVFSLLLDQAPPVAAPVERRLWDIFSFFAWRRTAPPSGGSFSARLDDESFYDDRASSSSRLPR